jgi:hypothetical protein
MLAAAGKMLIPEKHRPFMIFSPNIRSPAGAQNTFRAMVFQECRKEVDEEGIISHLDACFSFWVGDLEGRSSFKSPNRAFSALDVFLSVMETSESHISIGGRFFR